MSTQQPDSVAAYGDAWAERYDEFHDEAGALEAVECVHRLRPGGRVLEMGVGTGRLAIPLAESGFEVHGIDASSRMLDILRGKDPDGKVNLHEGDFCDTRLDLSFDVVIFSKNTLFYVLDAGAQEQALRCARSLLRDGGIVIVHADIPKSTMLGDISSVRTAWRGEGEVAVSTGALDEIAQIIRSDVVVLSHGGWQILPTDMRYIWVSELDLMARLAGLSLTDRWADWVGRPLRSGSQEHVSIYSGSERQ